MSKPFAWSHSALDQYNTCPHRYYKTRVSKEVVEPETPAILWGNRVHKMMEDSIRDNTPLPEEGWSFQKVLDSLKKIPGTIEAERKFAIDRKFNPVEFLGPDAWCRCITDVFILNGPIACAFDWKTGKIKYDFRQLELNALLIFAHYPEVMEVKAAYIWLKHKELTKATFKREETKWDKYLSQVGFMENSFVNNFWPKRKSGLCRDWCPVHTCQYNGKYKPR